MQHVDEGTIHAWLDGALAPEEAARVEQHVDGCERCEHAVAEARGLIAASSRILLSLDEVPGGVMPGREQASGSVTDSLAALRARQAEPRGHRDAHRFRRMTWLAAAVVTFMAIGSLSVLQRASVRRVGGAVAPNASVPVVAAPPAATTALTDSSRAVEAKRANPPADRAPGAEVASRLSQGVRQEAVAPPAVAGTTRADSASSPGARGSSAAAVEQSLAVQAPAPRQANEAASTRVAMPSAPQPRPALPAERKLVQDSLAATTRPASAERAVVGTEVARARREERVDAGNSPGAWLAAVVGCYEIDSIGPDGARRRLAAQVRLDAVPADSIAGIRWYRAASVSGDRVRDAVALRWRALGADSLLIAPGLPDTASGTTLVVIDRREAAVQPKALAPRARGTLLGMRVACPR